MNGTNRFDVTDFSDSLSTANSSGWRPISTDDFNHDGDPDLLWHNGTTGLTQIWFLKGTMRDASAQLPSSLNVPDSSGWRLVKE
jgi:hypothetical protein